MLYIDFLNNAHLSKSRGVLLACVMAVLLAVWVISRHLMLFLALKLGLITRKALTSLLYQKVLRLSSRSVASTSVGRLVNMASGDMTFIEQSSEFLPYMIAPFAGIVNIVILFSLVRVVSKLDWRTGNSLHRWRSSLPSLTQHSHQ